MPLEALISLNFLEGENSHHGFTTGQMKIYKARGILEYVMAM